jgi:hypothetical protein
MRSARQLAVLSVATVAIGGCTVLLCGCTTDGDVQQKGSLRVTVTAIDGVAYGDLTLPLPANLGLTEEVFDFEVEAIDGEGNADTSFNGFGRVSMVPGAVSTVVGGEKPGRNLLLVNGRATGQAVATAMFGSTYLWVEDIGYQPTPIDQVPACSNGTDDDGDVVNDFPIDAGCAFPDDNSEEGGTLLTGVSQQLSYALPTVAEVQGLGSETPYKATAVEVRTTNLEPTLSRDVIITRVSSNGFYLTDLSELDMNGVYTANGYNHLFAFNFNTPSDMRVCDRVTLLTGTMSEFFGFTEMSFPSYELGIWDESGIGCDSASRAAAGVQGLNADEFCRDQGAGDYCRRGRCQPCPLPEPPELDNTIIADDAAMEQLEGGLVRMSQLTIAENLGKLHPELVNGAWVFTRDATNCDLNDDGTIDFFDTVGEGSCSNACSVDPNCSDYIGFAARGNYKANRGGGAMIQINTGTAGGFDPLKYRGQMLSYITGSLRNFSGGFLNWTIETRCKDDLVCSFADEPSCTPDLVPTTIACSVPPTRDDNDAGTN